VSSRQAGREGWVTKWMRPLVLSDLKSNIHGEDASPDWSTFRSCRHAFSGSSIDAENNATRSAGYVQ